MFESHQKLLIKRAVAGQIKALLELRQEVSTPPIAGRRNLKMASGHLIKKVNEEIGEYKKLMTFLNNDWDLVEN
jgi:hypothetical protein